MKPARDFILDRLAQELAHIRAVTSTRATRANDSPKGPRVVKATPEIRSIKARNKNER
jgi:hypothetical protein